MVCAQLARGEKEGQVIRSLCSTLQNTGSSPEIVATTMMASLRRVLEKQECDIMKDIGRTMHEQGTESKKIYLFVYVFYLIFICLKEISMNIRGKGSKISKWKWRSLCMAPYKALPIFFLCLKIQETNTYVTTYNYYYILTQNFASS